MNQECYYYKNIQIFNNLIQFVKDTFINTKQRFIIDHLQYPLQNILTYYTNNNIHYLLQQSYQHIGSLLTSSLSSSSSQSDNDNGSNNTPKSQDDNLLSNLTQHSQ
eukprot:UN07094